MQALDDYLDLIDAAREIGIHPQSLRRLVKQAKIPARLWQGKYLFHRPALQQFVSLYDPRPGRKVTRRLI
jgi:hypothetical protein